MDRLAPRTIKSWSYSTYVNFQKCPRRVYLQKIIKEPEPPLVIPEGKDEHPMLRGSRVHDAAEMYLKQSCELIPELLPFAVGFDSIKYLMGFDEYQFIIEDEWAFTKDWQVTGWHSEDAWVRMKLDCMVIKDTEAVVIDYKTGRRWGNEISHMIQAQLYQVAALLRYPHLEHVQIEYWYTDLKEIFTAPFTRPFGMRFLQKFDDIGERITEEILFNPKPSAHACKYCPYGVQNGTSICQSAYK